MVEPTTTTNSKIETVYTLNATVSTNLIEDRRETTLVLSPSAIALLKNFALPQEKLSLMRPLSIF